MSPASVLHYPSATDTPRRARRELVRTLQAWGVRGLDDVAALLTSELVTNSVMHAATDVEVRCDWTDRRLHVGVSDRSVQGPRLGPFDDARVGGHGIRIVDELADAWGIDPVDGVAKVVWFELSAPGPA